jgi:ACR3 family arsenite efflux pump ArsB
MFAYTSMLYMSLTLFININTELTSADMGLAAGTACVFIVLSFTVAYFIRRLLGMSFKLQMAAEISAKSTQVLFNNFPDSLLLLSVKE